MIGIIPAAGSGVRARPYTYEIHKGLFLIDGHSNIARLINIMRDDFCIEEIVITLGYMGSSIKETFGDGSAFGVRISYVENQHIDKGWAWSVLLAKPYLAGRHACVMLSDEFYLDMNLEKFINSDYAEHMATVAVKTVEDRELIKKNFSVECSETKALRLVENPRNITNDILGMASFILSPVVFKLLDEAYDSGRPSIDFVNFIDELIRDGHSVAVCELSGHYVNLNDVSSLEYATDIAIRHRLAGEEAEKQGVDTPSSI